MSRSVIRFLARIVGVAVTHQRADSPGIADDHSTNLDQLESQCAGTHALKGRFSRLSTTVSFDSILSV